MDNNAYMKILNDKIKEQLRELKGQNNENAMQKLIQGKNIMYQFMDFHYLDSKQHQDVKVKKQGQDIRVLKSYQTKRHEDNIKEFHLEERIQQDKKLAKQVKQNSKQTKTQYGAIGPIIPVQQSKKKRTLTPQLTKIVENDLYNPKFNRSFSVKREFNKNKTKYNCKDADIIFDRFVKTSVQKTPQNGQIYTIITQQFNQQLFRRDSFNVSMTISPRNKSFAKNLQNNQAQKSKNSAPKKDLVRYALDEIVLDNTEMVYKYYQIKCQQS